MTEVADAGQALGSIVSQTLPKLFELRGPWTTLHRMALLADVVGRCVDPMEHTEGAGTRESVQLLLKCGDVVQL